MGEDGRLDPVTLCAMSLASEVYRSTLLLARIDVTHDPLYYLPSERVERPHREKGERRIGFGRLEDLDTNRSRTGLRA